MLKRPMITRITKILTILAIACSSFHSSNVQAQLVISGANNQGQVEALVNTLKNSRGGVSVSNVTWSAYGTAQGETGTSIGSFSAQIPFQTMSSGVVLSNGKINNIQGPNYLASAGSDLQRSGDIDISMLMNGVSRDAAILEFDVVSSGNSIRLEYLFASEEYPEKVCAALNDAFAIFISGPGINGKMNIAQVPGYPGVPAGINTINNGPGNAPGVISGNCPINYNLAYIDNPVSQASNSVLQYDGYTALMEASASVQPCQQYHIKIVVADGGDALYDSGLLLKAGSLSSETISITPSGSTSICANETVVLSVPSGYYSYQWRKDGVTISGATLATYTASSVGSYSVEIKKQSCSPVLLSANLAVQLKTPFQSGVNSTSLNLCASPSGVTLTAAHPNGTYKWTPGDQTTRAITVTTPGTYSVEVEDNGCKATYNAVVRGNTMTINTDTIGAVSCYNLKDGFIHISVIDKASTFTYQWTKEEDPFTSSLQDLCCLKAGIYTVTVTDADGCIKTKTEEVTEPTELIVTAAQVEGTGGSVNATVSGSVPPYMYAWKNNVGTVVATTEDLESMTAGTYTLTVSDSKNCTKTVTVTITGGCNASALTTVTPASCVSTPDGAIVLTVSNLTGAITYAWVGPEYAASTANISAIKAGQYTYTATNGSQCKATGTVTVGAPLYSVSATVTNPACHGGSTGSATATLLGGIAPHSLEWKDASQQIISTATSTGAILAAGTYTVTATGGGCSTTSTLVVSEPEELTVSLIPTDVTCFGQTNGSIATVAAGGTAPYSYSWQGPQSFTSSNAQLSALAAGTYTLVLSDARQCTAQYTPASSVVVNSPAEILVIVTPETTQGHARASVTSGGVAPFTYLWSNQQNTDIATGLKAGTVYTVTATGQDGCSASSAPYSPNNGCGISITMDQVTAMSCYATNNGSISVSVTGGTAPYTYAWTGPEYTGNTEEITGLSNGVYTLMVTDNNNCTAITSATVQRPLGLTAALTETQITCHDLVNGSIITAVSGGIPGAAPAPDLYLFSWKKDGNSFAATKNLTALAQGVYEVTITDANNCQIVLSKTIVNPDLLAANAVKSDITCFGNTDGKADVTVTGGTAPYTYAWTKLGGGYTSTLEDIQNLTAGTYNLIVTDSKGCTAQASAVINAPASLLILTLDSKTDITCAGTSNGTAQISASGGYGSITYAWKLFGNTIAITGTEEDQTTLKAGDYTVYVTDAGGCVKSQAVQITEPTAPAILISGAQNICTGESLTLSSTQTGTAYKWKFNNQSSEVGTAATYEINSAAQSGYYVLEVTKTAECTESSAPVQVTVNPKPLATITTERINFCAGNQALLTAVYYPDGVYTWKRNGTTLTTPSPANSLVTTVSGTYTLDISTPLCAADQGTITLNQYSPFEVTTSVTNATCSPSNNGAIAASASGQFGTVSWDWAHLAGASDPASISGLADGYYTVTATDAAGCMVVKQVTVIDSELNVQSTVNNISCAGGTNGTISINPTYTSPNPTGNCYAGTPISSYSCASGCTSLSGSAEQQVFTGDTYCIAVGQTYTGKLIMNGGTVIVCGTIDTRSSNQDLTFNAGTFIINPGAHVLTNRVLNFSSNGSGLSVKNYGELTGSDFELNNNADFENYGSVILSGYLHINWQTKLTNNSTITVGTEFTNNTGNIISLINYGTLAVTNAFNVLNTSINNNFCTISAASLNLNNGTINNSKIINISGTTDIGWGQVLNQQAGAKIETHNLNMNGGVINGLGASCSSVKVNGATVINWGGTFGGQTGICPTQSIVNNYGPQAYGAQVTTNCSCTANGGGSPVACAVQWTGPGLAGNTSGNTISNLGLGTYTANITCGTCSKQFTYNVTEPPLLFAKTEQIAKPSCFGQTNGGIDISVTGGTPYTPPAQSYTYAWTGPLGFSSSSQDINNAGAGNYKVIVTDKNNCTFTIDSIEIIQPALLSATVECSGGPSCIGAANGSAYANITGGTQPFNFIWTKQGDLTPLESNGQSIGGLPAGTYQLLVKDFNNCEATATVVVPEATNDCITNCTLSLTLGKQDATCPTFEDGFVYVTVEGATGAVTYDWTHKPGTNDAASLGYVTGGTYTLKVTDTKGCTSQQTTTVGTLYAVCEDPVFCKLNATIENNTAVSCPGSTDGSVTIGATGANGAISIDWIHIPGTQNNLTLTGLAPGIYRAQLSDTKGCTAPVAVTISGKIAPQLYSASTVICPQNPVTLVSSYETGNSWSTGATTREIIATAPGTYTLTTLIPGCSTPAVNQVVLTAGVCSSVSVTCDPPIEETVEYVDGCKDDELEIAFSNAYERYFQYIEDLKQDFRNRYISRCLDVTETLTAEYGDNEHHYTLYYYDQAGNLVRTVPPKGVNKLSSTQADQALIDYQKNTKSVYTDHTLTSTYTYNSLNQLIGQNIPDHDPMELTRIAPGSAGIDPAYTVSAAHFPSSGDKGFVLAYDNNDDGRIYFTQNGGASWSELSTVSTENILDVEKINDNVLHAVGNKGTYIVSTDGGQRWILKETGLSADLIKLHFSSYTLPLTDGILFDKQGKLYQTTDGGANWALATGEDLLADKLQTNSATLTDLYFRTNTEVYASAKNNTSGFIYKSVDGGFEWELLQNIRSTAAVLYTSMPTAQVTVATTASNYILSSPDEVNWKIVGNKSTSAYTTNAIHFLSVSQGVRTTSTGELLYTNDGGATWTLSNSGIVASSIQEMPSKIVYIVKTDNKIYKSTSGGFTPWTLASSNLGSSTITAVAAPPNDAFIATANLAGQIEYRPTSIAATAGHAWPKIFFASIPFQITKFIIRDDQNGSFLLSDGSVHRFVSNAISGGSVSANPYYGNTGFADLIAVNNSDNLIAYKSDGSLIYSINGGVTWLMGTSMPLTGTQPFRGLSTTISAGKIIASVGDAAGNIYRNDDLFGTGTWQNAVNYLRPQPITAVSMNSAGVGVATTTENVFLKTIDAGNHWTMLPYNGLTNLPAGTTFTEVAQSGSEVIIGTSAGTIYSSTDNGTTWTLNSTGTSNSSILKIETNSAGRVFALNQTGRILYRNLGNTNWTNITPNVVNDPLYDIVFTTGNDKTIVVGGAGKVLVANNNSTLFANVTNSDAPVLYASEMTSVNTGYAAGKDGVVVKTTNGGQKWSELNSGTNKTLFALDFLNDNKGVIAGDAIIRITANGGTDNFSAYSITTTPASLSGYTFRKAQFVDAQHIFLAGYQGLTGIVFTSSDGGQSFTKETTTFLEPIHSVSFFNTTDGIMAGPSDDHLYKITRSGDTYTYSPPIVIPSTLMNSRNIMNLSMVSPLVWYVVGEDGLMLRTDDAGLNWIDLNNEEIETDLSFITTRPDGQLAIGGNGGSIVYLTDERSRFTDKFWYDELGRLVASQNSKQNNYTPQKAYSYTLYDFLGRITEVGEVLTEHDIIEVINNRQASQVNYKKFSEEFLPGKTRRQITRTYYDAAKFTVPTLSQTELRNRVASITYLASEDALDANTYDYATHYSYDVHGNVKSLVQDNAKLARDYASFAVHRYKRVDYAYDLISGNVQLVSYQKGLDDQFYHKYEYDGDNRITNVYTSRDGKLFEQDAKYFYYRHGPLARAEIGNDKVQAMDYAYTLQGWIKGVNSTLLTPANDQGKDASTTTAGNLHRYVATDAASYTLNYYTGDYKSIANIADANKFEGINKPATMSGVGQNLFNGNISSMTTTIHSTPPPGYVDPVPSNLSPQGHLVTPQLTAYKYDQLNRIKELKAYRGLSMGATNSWASATSNGDYDETFSYDANGNITFLNRKGYTTPDHTNAMDQFAYNYEYGTDYNRNTNRLRAVADNEPTNTVASGFNDIQPGQVLNTITPSASNYDYDNIGNLIKDASEQIDNIEWNVYGKVTKVIRTATSTKDDLEFLYDASGNRTAKIVKPAATKANAATWTTTWYVRDAQGNTLTTYEQAPPDGTNGTSTFLADEFTLYGSSRLGTRQALPTITYFNQEAPVNTQVTPPPFEAGACDIELTDNNALYSIKHGQRGVIPEGVEFTGKVIQEGGTLLVQGTFDAGATSEATSKYTYLGGEIVVTGTLKSFSLTPVPAVFYDFCNYNANPPETPWVPVTLQPGTYDLDAMITAGIPNDDVEAIKVGAGYKVTIYEDQFLGGAIRTYTSNMPCLETLDPALNDKASGIVVERITTGLVESECAPSGTTANVINNYGTIEYHDTHLPAGFKVNNYGQFTVSEIKLANNVEFNNFGTVNNSFFEITTPTAVVNQKPTSHLTTDVLNVYGKVQGDDQNFSTVTTSTTNVYAGASITGLLKFCVTQLNNNGTIAGSVIQDCAFEIPGSVSRATVKYELSAGLKRYEFSNHLGNVLTTVSDRRIGVSLSGNPNLIDHYTAVILSSSDYYAFGSEMKGRGYAGTQGYRYGFQGQEKDGEITEGLYTAEYWEYDSRIGRRWNVDPVTKHDQSPYSAFANNPIWIIDVNGADSSASKASATNSPQPVAPLDKKLTGSTSLYVYLYDDDPAKYDKVKSQQQSGKWDYVVVKDLEEAEKVLKQEYGDKIAFVQNMVIRSHGRAGQMVWQGRAITETSLTQDRAFLPEVQSLVYLRNLLTDDANIMTTACNLCMGRDAERGAKTFATFFTAGTLRNYYANWATSVSARGTFDKDENMTSFWLKFDQGFAQPGSTGAWYGGFVRYFWGPLSHKPMLEPNYYQLKLNSKTGGLDNSKIPIPYNWNATK
jgi:RHS repeat-associated protein